MFVDIHVLQTVPMSNLNRDDTGAPKTVTYGGVTRLRVSSQSWKRAARIAMEHGQEMGTYRTRNPHLRLAALLAERGFSQEDATTVAVWAFGRLGTGADKGSVILFAAEAELVALADLLTGYQQQLTDTLAAAPDPSGDVEEPKAKGKGKKKSAAEESPLDEVGPTRTEMTAVFTGCTKDDCIGLFGRMLAENQKLNVDAAVQVAHAFSTHGVQLEMDFFVAAEDLPSGDDSGGAHLDTAEFASGTLYRYAAVDVRGLVGHCDGDRDRAAELVAQFVQAFALSLPSGKKNSTAPNSVPAVVSVSVRPDRSVSYAGAFESSVRSRNGYERPSLELLDVYAGRAGRFAEPATTMMVNASDVEMPNLGQELSSMTELCREVAALVAADPVL